MHSNPREYAARDITGKPIVARLGAALMKTAKAARATLRKLIAE
jgi:hypothetical protein